jgi:hypothetical protein
VSVDLGTLREMRMRHIDICGLHRSTTVLRIILLTARFSLKKKAFEQKMCFDFLYKLCLKYF